MAGYIKKTLLKADGKPCSKPGNRQSLCLILVLIFQI